MTEIAKPVRTAAATAALIRRTDEKLAARLREHGWICTPPAPTAEIESAS